MRKLLGLFALCAAALAASPVWAASSSLNYTSSGSSGVRMTTDGTTNCTGATACFLNNNIIYGDPAATAPASQTGANQLAVTTRNSALIEGVGVGGASTGGVLSVQGVGGGTAVPISGAINPAVSANWGIGATGSAVPANGVLSMMSNAGTATALQGDSTNGLWVNIKSSAAALHQSTNIDQILGVAPSATNPLWVAEAQTAGLLIQNLGSGATGTGTSLAVTGYASALLTVQCTTACTGTIQGTDASGLYFSVQGYPVGGGSATSAIAGSGQFWVPVNGLTFVRANITANPSSGSVLVTGTAQAGTFPVAGSSSGGGTVTQGPQGSTGSPWFVTVTQGGNQQLVNSNGFALIDYASTSLAHLDAIAGLATGTNPIGYMQPATAFLPIMVATGGDNHQTICTTAAPTCTVAMQITGSNHWTSPLWLRIYDATAFNGCNATTGLKHAVELIPNDSDISISLGGGSGIALTSGFSICVTAGPALNDTTVVPAGAANSVILAGSYR